MTGNRFIQIFEEIFPGFFQNEGIKSLPEDAVYEEMFLELASCSAEEVNIQIPENVTFGFFKGDRTDLLSAVAKVDEDWIQFFGEHTRVFCAYAGDRLASFCILDDMGTHFAEGREWRVGGPGCVGTVPDCRRQGIGLSMVQQATRILKAEGYDLSFVHYTGVGNWYRKLGYKTELIWDRNGIIDPDER